jgi:hypothetical protein
LQNLYALQSFPAIKLRDTQNAFSNDFRFLFAFLSVLGAHAMPTSRRAFGPDGNDILALDSRSPAGLIPATNPKIGSKPVQPTKPQSSNSAAPLKPPSGQTSHQPGDVAAPTSKVIRVTTPINTCRLPFVRREDDYENIGGLEEDEASVANTLEKRGSARKYNANLGNSVGTHTPRFPTNGR